MNTIQFYLVMIGICSFINLILFAVDKKLSANEANARIPEIVLLSMTAFGGAPGAAIGMYVIRHKTNFVTKFHFAITVWLSLICQAALILFMI